MSATGTRFEPLDVEELERIAREQYARAHPKRTGPGPRPRNVQAARLLVEADRLAIRYRGRDYELLPVGFADGVLFSDCRFAIEAREDEDRLTPEVVRDYLTALRTVVRLAPKYLRPVGRLRRWAWRLGFGRNPYRGATEAEIGQLLGFFLGCRMRSRIQYPAGA